MLELLNDDWQTLLKAEGEKPYLKALEAFVDAEYAKTTVFPPKNKLFSALNATSFDNVKVVLIGQDPYHGDGQANGMCFSVNPDCPCPPSLLNIFQALYYDLGIRKDNGDLTPWAKQGVLLLNTVLTVRKGQPKSHGGRGWEEFTDAIIRAVNAKETPVVFLLWGSSAHAKETLITNPRHLALKSVHPSPLSFYRGFLECRHFSKANDFLLKNNLMPIEW